MEKSFGCCQQITCAVAILLGVLIGWWICQKTVETSQGSAGGGGVGSTGAHLTRVQTLGSTTCSSPPAHVSPTLPPGQPVTSTNPTFCWDTFTYSIGSWRFDLYTNPPPPTPPTAVPGCSTGGFVPTTTTNIQCTGTTLTVGGPYKGTLQYYYTSGAYGSESHPYIAQ